MKICMVSLSGLSCYLDPPADGTSRAGWQRGGSETQLATLARALVARGHEVSAVVTDFTGAESPRAKEITLINAYHSGVGLPVIRFLFPRWSGLRRALRRADAEIYFQRGASAATGQVAHTCGALRRPFLFGTASDTDADPRRLRQGARARWLYGYGLRRAAAVVTQHQAQRESLLNLFGVESEVIGSISPFFPDAPPEPTHPPTVLWLGNFREVKRPELFLDLARRFPHTRFVMVGGPTRSEPEVFEQTRSAAAALPNVEFVGPAADPSPHLAGAWVLVNTSRVEGFPSTFLEAWAHGVPTISFVDPGGVVSRENIGVVSVDAEDLSARLGALLADRSQRDAMGSCGRDYVRREHRADGVAERYERLFAATLERAARTGTSP